ncbi:MAG: hypothetical protein M1840_008278 [Geoglossum simile]|nr:MAG: hypothetical protein M1840_008278 [Geoglossum simile]
MPACRKPKHDRKPEYYISRLKQQAVAAPCKKKRANITSNMMARAERDWREYCTFIAEDPDNFLEACAPQNFKNYLDWKMDMFSIKKLKSIATYWRNLRMVYTEKTGQALEDSIGREIMNYIHGPLKEEHDLEDSETSLPVMSVNDLFQILQYHWAFDAGSLPHERQRVQLSLLLLMMAYTSSRPGAIVESGCAKGSNEALCYKDVKILVIPGSDGAYRDTLVMTITLRYMKGCRGGSKVKTYVCHERDDTLAFCPILPFLALAIDDDAFEIPELKSPEHIFQIKVNRPRKSLHLRWKESILDTPVFRRSVRAADGIRTSHNMAMPYDTLNTYMKRLGRSAGFREDLKPYCIRRGTANSVDSIATDAERNQVMGHIRGQVFERNYLSSHVKIDVQSAYLGSPSQDALIRALGQMSLSQDLRAPKSLSAEQATAIKHHPKVAELQGKCNDLRSRIKLKYGKIKSAKDTEIYCQYQLLKKELLVEIQRQRQERLCNERKQFFNTIDSREIQQQFSGLSSSGTDEKQIDIDVEARAQHISKERTRIADGLFRLSADSTDQERYGLRVQVLTDLVALCRQRESPSQERSPHNDLDKISDTPEPDLLPIACLSTQCLFCLGDNHLSNHTRTFSYSRVDALKRHVATAHLRYLAADKSLTCPHPACKEDLNSIEHFKNHAATVHGVFM